MDRPGEVFRRRHIFQPTLKSLKCEGKEEEYARRGNGLGKDPDWDVGKM